MAITNIVSVTSIYAGNAAWALTTTLDATLFTAAADVTVKINAIHAVNTSATGYAVATLVANLESSSATITGGTITGITDLVVADGGTGVGTFTSNGVLYGNGTGAIQATAAGTDTYIMYSNSGTPAWTNVISGGTY